MIPLSCWMAWSKATASGQSTNAYPRLTTIAELATDLCRRTSLSIASVTSLSKLPTYTRYIADRILAHVPTLQQQPAGPRRAAATPGWTTLRTISALLGNGTLIATIIPAHDIFTLDGKATRPKVSWVVRDSDEDDRWDSETDWWCQLCRTRWSTLQQTYQ